MRKGFSLLELLVVTVIISILAGFTFPLAKKSVEAAEFKNLVNKVYFFLDYAKTQAVIRNEVLEAEFGPEKNKVTLRREGSEEEVLSQIQLSPKAALTPGVNKIIFYPDGTPQRFKVGIFLNERRAAVLSKGFDGKIYCEN